MGIDINSRALNGDAPLHDAIRLGKREMETLLISRGADLEIRDGEGNTPFLEAVEAGFPETVERLYNLGANPAVRNLRGDTPLHKAVALNRTDLAVLLLGWGVSIHARNSQGKTPFEMALVTSPRMVATLLTKDRLSMPDDDGNTPLHIAVLQKAPEEMIRAIIDLGAGLSASDSSGRTPLRIAVDQEDWRTAKILADAGSDVFLPAADGRSPAEIALRSGVDAVSALFSGKAINSQDSAGNTILHYAASQGDPAIIQLLIKLGANKSIKNIAGESPADIARRWKRSETLDLLQS
jgi:ankyrin repeat protein